MLKVKNISAGFGKKQVLYNISFEVKSGKIVLLTGGNGCGKSTLLKCIYNLLPIWSGEIWFEDERIDGLPTYKMIRKGIVYIPQADFCFENLTVEENLKVAGNIYHNKELFKKIEIVYEQTGLMKFRKRKPFNLSGGERKLLAFGMSLIHLPKLIMLDEPFAGLDNNSSVLIKSICETINKSYLVSLLIIEQKSLIGLNVAESINFNNINVKI